MLLLKECGKPSFEPNCITFYLSISIFWCSYANGIYIFIRVARLLYKLGVTFKTFSTEMVITAGVLWCTLIMDI